MSKYKVRISDIAWLYHQLSILNDKGLWISDYYTLKKIGDRKFSVIEIINQSHFDVLCQVAKKAKVEIKRK